MESLHPWCVLAERFGQHPLRFREETTPFQAQVLAQWTHYAAAQGDGSVQEAAPKLTRGLDEIPEDWTPPSKEEVAKTMQSSLLSRDRAASVKPNNPLR